MKKVWFVTGSSRGLGRAWATAALERGDSVVATARNPKALNDLVDRYSSQILALPLDVTDRSAVKSALDSAYSRFGRLDVLINNAGYGLFCSVEDASEQETKAVFDTNFFGSLNLIQEIMPHFRKQESGHIIQVSSIAGLLALPGIGLYNATKWATEGLLETLYHEAKAFGIKVSIVEPGPHDTDWLGKSSVRPERNSAYPATEEYMVSSWPRLTLSSPESSVSQLMTLVDAENPPLRLLMGGNDLEPVISKALQERSERLAQYGHEGDLLQQS